MKINPRIIRPRPDTITRVMSVVKEHLFNAERASFSVPLARTGPTVSYARGDRTCISARLDRKMRSGVDIVSRGGRFEVTFGPELSILDVAKRVKQFAGSRHGSKISGVMENDFLNCSAKIAFSATARSMESFMDFDGPHDIVHSSDSRGNPIILDVCVGVENVGSAEGSLSDPDADGKIELSVDVPSKITIGMMKGSEKFGEYTGRFMSEVRTVVEHELTHASDPGVFLEKYLGGPEKIMGMSNMDRMAAIDVAMAEGDIESAQALRDLYLKAYEEYASQPQEVRAEASVALIHMRLYATYWQRKNGRTLTPKRAVEIMDKEFDSKVMLYQEMSEQAKLKVQRYVIQALQEEGLVTS